MHARRLFTAWLFALPLLFGQAAALAHALSHLGEHDSDHAPGTTCELCMVQASLGAALPPSPLFGLPGPAAPEAAALPLPHSPQTCGPIPSARAPPFHAV